MGDKRIPIRAYTEGYRDNPFHTDYYDHLGVRLDFEHTGGSTQHRMGEEEAVRLAGEAVDSRDMVTYWEKLQKDAPTGRTQRHRYRQSRRVRRWEEGRRW